MKNQNLKFSRNIGIVKKLFIIFLLFIFGINSLFAALNITCGSITYNVGGSVTKIGAYTGTSYSLTGSSGSYTINGTSVTGQQACDFVVYGDLPSSLGGGNVDDNPTPTPTPNPSTSPTTSSTTTKSEDNSGTIIAGLAVVGIITWLIVRKNKQNNTISTPTINLNTNDQRVESYDQEPLVNSERFVSDSEIFIEKYRNTLFHALVNKEIVSSYAADDSNWVFTNLYDIRSNTFSVKVARSF